jgi:sugar phosphate isomerase/epimerase
MNVGMITCNYYLRIYGYKEPEGFNWGTMTDKYRKEFCRADFLKLAGEIRALGCEGIEIWEPMFSHRVYREADAASMAAELGQMGFKSFAYCIGGWGPADTAQVEPAYRFARALGAKVVAGCMPLEGTEELLREIERCGKLYGLFFAIENHPAPSIEKPEDVLSAAQEYVTIGANLDTGIYNYLGYDVIAAANLLREKVFHVHLKDSKNGAPGCLPLGKGDAPLTDLLKVLRLWGYDGMLSVEYEHEGDPAPGLAESLRFIQKHLA